jgi:CheY-like chemotaxis protein
MSKPVKVLLVEDSERDAALMLLYLRRGGFDPTLERVESEQEMKEHLDRTDWDIVISDFNLPKFSAHGALKLLRDGRHNVPLIVLSGGIPDSEIENVMKAGAVQYLGKEQMKEIVPAIERAMQARG